MVNLAINISIIKSKNKLLPLIISKDWIEEKTTSLLKSSEYKSKITK